MAFWLNMEQAVGPTDYGDFTGFPNTVVKNLKVVSPTELTFTLDKPVLAVLVAVQRPEPGHPDAGGVGPHRVRAQQLRDHGQRLRRRLQVPGRPVQGPDSYVSSPLWSVVDGPWKLSAFNADGHVTFVPNKSYSGPVKPKLSEFQEVPFTTDSAEYDVLQSPSSSSKIDVGYIPAEDLPAKPAGAVVGANPLASHGYTLSPLYGWAINYYVVNFQSTVSDHAAVIKQLYFRQALAYLMNQAAVIQGPLKGYGTLTVGPVGNNPPTQWLSAQGKRVTRSRTTRPRPRAC